MGAMTIIPAEEIEIVADILINAGYTTKRSLIALGGCLADRQFRCLAECLLTPAQIVILTVALHNLFVGTLPRHLPI